MTTISGSTSATVTTTTTTDAAQTETTPSTTTTGAVTPDAAKTGFESSAAAATAATGPSGSVTVGDKTYEVVNGEVRVDNQSVGRMDDSGNYSVTLGGQKVEGNVGALVGAVIEGTLSTGKKVSNAVEHGEIALGDQQFVVTDGKVYEVVNGKQGTKLGTVNTSGDFNVTLKGQQLTGNVKDVEGLTYEGTTADGKTVSNQATGIANVGGTSYEVRDGVVYDQTNARIGTLNTDNEFVGTIDGKKISGTTTDFVDTSRLSAKEAQELNKVMEAHPTFNGRDVNSFIAANPTSWKATVGELSMAVDLAKSQGLTSAQGDALAQAVLAGQPTSDVSALAAAKDGRFEKFISQAQAAGDLARAQNMTAEQGQQLMRLMTNKPNTKADDVKTIIKDNPDSWSTMLRQVDTAATLAKANTLNETKADALTQLLLAQPTWGQEQIGRLINAGGGKFDQALTQASAATTIAAEKGLTLDERLQLVRVMTGNPAFTEAEVKNYIAGKADRWKGDLHQLDQAQTVMSHLQLGESARATVNRLMLADPTLTAAKVADYATNRGGTAIENIERLELGVSKQFTAAQMGQLEHLMQGSPDLKLSEVRTYIDAHADSWPVDLWRLDTQLSATELATAHQLNDADRTLLSQWMVANPLLPADSMKSMLAGKSPEQIHATLQQVDAANTFAANAKLSDAQRDAVVRILGADANVTAAELEKFRTGAPEAWPVILERFDNAQSVSTLLGLEGADSKMMRQLMLYTPGADALGVLGFVEANPDDWKSKLSTMAKNGEYAATSWNPTGGRDPKAPDAPTYPERVGRGLFDKNAKPSEAETTGDSRNKDLPHLSNLSQRYQAFAQDIGGKNYKDAPADVVKLMDTPHYLARQLEDQAKALGTTFQNKAGDTAAQMGVYLDMLGVKDVSRLRVVEGRIVDTSNSKDLGKFEPDQAFSYSAIGDGWTDFYAKKLDIDQVVFVPKWGDSSDIKKIAIVASVALAFTGVGAAVGAGLMSAAGASSAFLATTAGSVISGALGSAVVNTAISGISGQGASLSSFAKNFGSGLIAGGINAGVNNVMSGLDVGGGLKLGDSWAGNALIKGVGGGLTSTVLGGSFTDGFVSGAVSSAVNSGASHLLGSDGLDLGWSRESIAGAATFLGSYLTNGHDLGKALISSGEAYSSTAKAERDRLIANQKATDATRAAGTEQTSGTGAGRYTLNTNANFGSNGTGVKLGDGTDGSAYTWDDKTAPLDSPRTNLRAIDNAMLPQTRTVQSGDTLSGIAKELLGDANRWPELYAYNAKVMSNNPNALKAGIQLEIPPSSFTIPSSLANKLHDAAYIPPPIVQAPTVDPLALAATLPFEPGAFLSFGNGTGFSFLGMPLTSGPGALPGANVPATTPDATQAKAPRGFLETVANGAVNSIRMVDGLLTDASIMTIELAKMAIPGSEANKTFQYIMREELGPWLDSKLSTPGETASKIGAAFEKAVGKATNTVMDPGKWGSALGTAWEMVTGGTVRLAETLAQDPTMVSRELLIQRGNDAIMGVALAAGLKGAAQLAVDGFLAANGVQMTLRGLASNATAVADAQFGYLMNGVDDAAAAGVRNMGQGQNPNPFGVDTFPKDQIQGYVNAVGETRPSGMLVNQLVPKTGDAGAAIDALIADAQPLDRLLYNTFNKARSSGVPVFLEEGGGGSAGVFADGSAYAKLGRGTLDYTRLPDGFEIVGMDPQLVRVANHELKGHVVNSTRAAANPEMPNVMGLVEDPNVPGLYRRFASVDEVQSYNIGAASNRDVYLSAMKSDLPESAAQALRSMESDLDWAKVFASRYEQVYGNASTPENLALARQTMRSVTDGSGLRPANMRVVEFELADASGGLSTVQTAVPISTYGNPDLAFAYVKAQLQNTKLVIEVEKATSAMLESDLAKLTTHALSKGVSLEEFGLPAIASTAIPGATTGGAVTASAAPNVRPSATPAQLDLAADLSSEVVENMTASQRTRFAATVERVMREEAVGAQRFFDGLGSDQGIVSAGSKLSAVVDAIPNATVDELAAALRKFLSPAPKAAITDATRTAIPSLATKLENASGDIAQQLIGRLNTFVETAGGALAPEIRRALTQASNLDRALGNAQLLYENGQSALARALATTGDLSAVWPESLEQLVRSAGSTAISGTPAPELIAAMKVGPVRVQQFFDALKAEASAATSAAERAANLQKSLGLQPNFPMPLWNLEALSQFEKAPAFLREQLGSPSGAIWAELRSNPTALTDPTATRALIERLSRQNGGSGP